MNGVNEKERASELISMEIICKRILCEAKSIQSAGQPREIGRSTERNDGTEETADGKKERGEDE